MICNPVISGGRGSNPVFSIVMNDAKGSAAFYEFEQGMTFRDFLASPYNVHNMTAGSDRINAGSVGSGQVQARNPTIPENIRPMPPTAIVHPDEKIVAGYPYYMVKER